jgi:Leucine-rich repeat (LRR) protein
LPIFKARAVFLSGDAKAATLASLANQPQLEMLLVKSDEPGALDVLAKLPKLTDLVLGDWDPAKTGPLPAGMNHLRRLVIAGGDNIKDLSGLRNVPAELAELSVLETKNLTDITGLARFAHLSTLILNGDEGIGDLSGLATQQDLRWVGVPAKATQEEFAAFVAAHGNLEILDLMGNKTVSSLSPLPSLKHLQGLLLQGPYENMSAIQGLKTLKFLGVSDKVWDASPDQIAALKAALPDAVVVRVSPLCLGSGWILLLLPMLGFVWLARRRTIRRVAA